MTAPLYLNGAGANVLRRDEAGFVDGEDLLAAVADKLGVPWDRRAYDRHPPTQWQERFREVASANLAGPTHGATTIWPRAFVSYSRRFGPVRRHAIAHLLGVTARDLWPDTPDLPTCRPKNSTIAPVLATARAFRIAIDALPVGRDIRTRLLAHLDAHIAEIEAVASAC